METIHYLGVTGARERHHGRWLERAGGIVLMHTKHSQTLIPWNRVLMIEQNIGPSGLEPYEVTNKQLTNILRRD